MSKTLFVSWFVLLILWSISCETPGTRYSNFGSQSSYNAPRTPTPAPSPSVPYSFTGIQLFESGSDLKLVTPVYKTSFPQSTTRYISFQLDIVNHLYKSQAHSHNVVCRYYRSDGSQVGEIQDNFNVRPEWYTAYMRNGWGNSIPGKWAAGDYYVKIWMDGKELGQKNFNVYNDRTSYTPPAYIPPAYTPSSQKGYRYKSLKFFEGPKTLQENYKQYYTSSFSKASTRFIWCHIELDNLLYQQREQTLAIDYRYYKPGGTLHGTASANFLVKREWYSAWHEHSVGWEIPGLWVPGNYRVEVWIGGQKEGEGQFNIFTATIPQAAPQAPKTSPFPTPQKLQPIQGVLAEWEIHNKTPYTVNIRYTGPQSGSTSVPSGSTKKVYLQGGTYFVYGTCSDPLILPYSGSISLSGGWKYANEFFIIRK